VLNWDSPTKPDTPKNDLIKARDSEIDDQPAPVFVKTDDLLLRPIPGQLTHKLFAHIDCQGEELAWGQLYLGIGGEIEFAHNGMCDTCTAHQWGLWLRTGLNY
jgi:hypothetical protein